jgi:two-component system sensor histidine kinase CiaH
VLKSAKIKLTVAYVLIIMTITLSFSGIVYVNADKFIQRALTQHERRIETRLGEFSRNQMPPPGFQAPLTQETLLQIRKNTVFMLTLINLGVLLFTGSFSYWFASRTLKPIEEMIEKQKKFVGDAAHELKTPLTAMKTLLEVDLLNKNLDVDKAKKTIKSTIEEVDTLTSLTNNLLKQTKYQTDNGEKSLEKVNLRDVLDRTIQKFSVRAQEKEIKIIASSKDIQIKTVREELQELLTILLDNAIKFNKNNGLIKVKTREDSKFAYIKITDSGIGIDGKDLPYIFDRFYKADTSRTGGETEGFGLGLSIAKDIVQRLNGEITVRSKLGKGTAFTIKIPTNM